MNQASEWYQKQMALSVRHGEDPQKAIERIDAEEKTKIFARIEEKIKPDPLSPMGRMEPTGHMTPLGHMDSTGHMTKALTTVQAQAVMKAVFATAVPFYWRQPMAKPAQQEPLPQPPRPVINLPPVEPARYQYVIRAFDVCNDDGEIETVRFVVE